MCGGPTVPCTLALEDHAEVVAPQTDRRAFAGDPVVVIDFASFTTEFDVEAAWRLHVEGQHQVIDMAAEGRRHRHFATQRPVKAQPDVVGLLDLDHEMHDTAGCLARHERQAVVARIDAEEPQPRGWAIGGPTSCGGSRIESRSLKPSTSR